MQPEKPRISETLTSYLATPELAVIQTNLHPSLPSTFHHKNRAATNYPTGTATASKKFEVRETKLPTLEKVTINGSNL